MPKIFLLLLVCAGFSCQRSPIVPDLQTKLQTYAQTYREVKAANIYSELFAMLRKNTNAKQQYKLVLSIAYQIFKLGEIYNTRLENTEFIDSQIVKQINAEYKQEARSILTPFFTTTQAGIMRRTFADFDTLTRTLYHKYGLIYPENGQKKLQKMLLQSQLQALTHELVTYLGNHIGNYCSLGFYLIYIQLENPPAKVRWGETFQTEFGIGQETSQLYKFLSASSQIVGDSNLIYHAHQTSANLPDSANVEMPLMSLEHFIPQNLPVGKYHLLIRAEVQNLKTGQIHPIEQKLFFELKADYEQ